MSRLFTRFSQFLCLSHSQVSRYISSAPNCASRDRRRGRKSIKSHREHGRQPLKLPHNTNRGNALRSVPPCSFFNTDGCPRRSHRSSVSDRRRFPIRTTGTFFRNHTRRSFSQITRAQRSGDIPGRVRPSIGAPRPPDAASRIFASALSPPCRLPTWRRAASDR